ncbi:flagellar hook-basal body complex protein FliE, partial [Clostridium perfringens]|nr:flagellar hook-basal body complex protein FliE [Clostridium perfringens]
MIINNFVPTEKVFENNIVSDNKVNSNGSNFQNILKDSLD